MLEKALSGSRRYWLFVGVLLTVISVGVVTYFYQLVNGLGVTGMSRDVPWGFYIAQFTFLVGVAASAVMVVLPYYLHDYKAFGPLAVFGEFLAIAAVIMCMTFVFVDIGQPMRGLNLMLHPSPSSVMFWDLLVLSGYLVLNVVITRVTFTAERKGVKPPAWIKPIIILSIPWAISIHTVTAFLYAGLEARPFWLTAVLAPRFLASAFASGPSLLILLCLVMNRVSRLRVEKRAMHKLLDIATYAMAANLFFVLMEVFTAAYSGIPEHMHHFEYLFFGLGDATRLVPWMWTSEILALLALLMLLSPVTRRNNKVLVVACVAVIVSIWIDKGMGMVVTGFVPTPLGDVTEYAPTLPEVLISLGIYGIGALILTGLYKVAIGTRERIEQLGPVS